MRNTHCRKIILFLNFIQFVVYLFSGLRYYSFSKIKLFDKRFENLWVHLNTKWKKKNSSSNIFVFGDTWWISGQLFSLTVCVLKYNSMQPRCHLGTRDPCQVQPRCHLGTKDPCQVQPRCHLGTKNPCQVQHCYILLIFPFSPLPWNNYLSHIKLSLNVNQLEWLPTWP